jgi:hypothetical protein
MRGTVKRNTGALPGQGVGRPCLKLTAPTDVGANGLLLPVDAGMSGYNPDRGFRQDRRSVASVVAQAMGAT